MLTAKNISKFIIVAGLIVLYFVFRSKYFLIAAGILGAIFLLLPSLGDWIVKMWLKFGEALGYVNSRIILAILFFLILTPVALVQRIFKKDSLMLKRGSSSLFFERNHQYTKKDLENPW
jgi:hypothetical protein